MPKTDSGPKSTRCVRKGRGVCVWGGRGVMERERERKAGRKREKERETKGERERERVMEAEIKSERHR